MQQGLVKHLFEPQQLRRLQTEVTEDGGAGDAPQPDLQIVRRLVIGMHQPQRPRIGRQQESAHDQRDAYDDRGVDPGECHQARVLVRIHDRQDRVGCQGEDHDGYRVEQQQRETHRDAGESAVGAYGERHAPRLHQQPEHQPGGQVATAQDGGETGEKHAPFPPCLRVTDDIAEPGGGLWQNIDHVHDPGCTARQMHDFCGDRPQQFCRRAGDLVLPGRTFGLHGLQHDVQLTDELFAGLVVLERFDHLPDVLAGDLCGCCPGSGVGSGEKQPEERGEYQYTYQQSGFPLWHETVPSCS